MRLDHSQIFAMAIMVLMPAGRLIAEETKPADRGSAHFSVSDRSSASDGNLQFVDYMGGSDEVYSGKGWIDDSCLTTEPVPETLILAARFGWWSVNNSGSLTKTGEWQGLHPNSPFVDIDGLFSNLYQTVDFYASLPENEAPMYGLRLYAGPGLSANIAYERFLHRLDNKSPWGFNNVDVPPSMPPALPTLAIPINPNPPVVGNPAAFTSRNLDPGNPTQWSTGFNAGQDFAINVEQLKANFKGNLTDNLKWRLNVWEMEKQGIRQARGMAHCFTPSPTTTPPGPASDPAAADPNTRYTQGGRCHLQSQSQGIDWVTLEVEPALEWRLADGLSVEYSRTMRTFNQDDQAVFRTYNGAGAMQAPYVANTPAGYAVVPEAYTEIDRLKVFAQIGECTDAYVLGYIGNNEDRLRDTNRRFYGGDARITNQTIEGLQLTAYGKVYNTDTSHPERLAVAPFFDPTTFDPHLLDRQFDAIGFTSRWRPFYDDCSEWRRGLAMVGGYEYSRIQRVDARYELEVLNPNAVPPLTSNTSNSVPRDDTILIPFEFDQPDTLANKVFVGVTEQWTRDFNTSVKYTYVRSRYPLFGLTAGVLDGAAETAPGSNAVGAELPTDIHRVELGSTWQLVENFVLNGTMYLERTYHHSEFHRFDQDAYPWMVSAWYGATPRWHWSAGYAQLTSWIDQDITLGSQARYGVPGTHANDWEVGPGFTAPWRYSGKSDVVTLNTVYAATDRLLLNGGFEYVQGINAVALPPSPTDTRPNGTTFVPTPYTELADASRVEVETYRISAGFDYLLQQNLSTFFRYNWFDYGDRDQTYAYQSGTTSQVLAGVTGTY